PRLSRGPVVHAILASCPAVALFLAFLAVFCIHLDSQPRARPSDEPPSDRTLAIASLRASIEETKAKAPRPDGPLPSIDPSAVKANLAPLLPKDERAPVYLGDDLAGVPELSIEAAPGKHLTTEQWRSRKAHAAAVALYLDAKAEDGFLKTLLPVRPDLAGV